MAQRLQLLQINFMYRYWSPAFRGSVLINQQRVKWGEGAQCSQLSAADVAADATYLGRESAKCCTCDRVACHNQPYNTVKICWCSGNCEKLEWIMCLHKFAANFGMWVCVCVFFNTSKSFLLLLKVIYPLSDVSPWFIYIYTLNRVILSLSRSM